MSQAFGKFFPALEPIEDFSLFADGAAGAHGVVPGDAGEDEGDGERNRLRPRSAPDDDEEGGDERGVAARHAARAEEPALPVAGFESFHDDLRALGEEHHEEGDEEGVGAEEVEGGHGNGKEDSTAFVDSGVCYVLFNSEFTFLRVCLHAIRKIF